MIDPPLERIFLGSLLSLIIIIDGLSARVNRRLDRGLEYLRLSVQVRQLV